MSTNRIYVVTLCFAPPGPLHSSMLIAPNSETAVALATIEAMRQADDALLAGVAAMEVSPDALRRILRAAEGRTGPAEVVSLVRPEQRAAEILRQHPEAGLREEDAPRVYGEPFGPPAPDAA